MACKIDIPPSEGFYVEEERFRNNDYCGDFVYFVSDGEYTKIGHSAYRYRSSLRDRVSGIQVGNPKELRLIALIRSNRGKGYVMRIEKYLHEKYASKHERGEWYLLDKEDIQEALDEANSAKDDYYYEIAI